GTVDAARHADLNKNHLLAIVGVFLEKQVQGPEPFRYAFGVVNAINADAEPFIAKAQELATVFHFLFHQMAGSCFLVPVKINADGKWSHHGHLAPAADFEALMVHLGFERALHGIEEILTMGPQVEGEQIIAE